MGHVRGKMRQRRKQHGVVTVEYMEILVICILGAAVAMTPLGLHLVRYYDNMEFLTGLPFP
jgi:hypothetical protein